MSGMNRTMLLATLMLVAPALVPSMPLERNVYAKPSRHVVLGVDTSLTMLTYDPRFFAVLSAMVFGDLLRPDDRFEVVRFYRATDFETKSTGKTQPCPDDPTKICALVDIKDDVLKTIAAKRTGILARSRGPEGLKKFKADVPAHLVYDVVDTKYSDVLVVAHLLFEEDEKERIASKPPMEPRDRVLVFLSDGKPTEPADYDVIRRALKNLGVKMVAIALGPEAKGAPALRAIGVDAYYPLDSGSDLVRTFAEIYNKILGSQSTQSGSLDTSRSVSILNYVEDAFFLFYSETAFDRPEIVRKGGATLLGDWLEGSVADKGHYRILHSVLPEAGEYVISPPQVGTNVQFALIQEFSLTARYVGPKEASVNENIELAAEMLAGPEGARKAVTSAEILQNSTMHFLCSGTRTELHDDGLPPDRVAGDGVFAGNHRFSDVPKESCKVWLKNQYVDIEVPAELVVGGTINLDGPGNIDFGTVKAGQEKCLDIPMSGEVIGRFPVRFEPTNRIDDEIRISVGGQKIGTTNPAEVEIATSERTVRFCIDASAGAGAMDRRANPVRLRPYVPGVGAFTLQGVDLQFEVVPLSFWERWGRLILTILGILGIVFIIAGYVYPARFPRNLGIVSSERVEDLGALSPTLLTKVRGGRGGFWRHAKVGVNDDGLLRPAREGSLFLVRAEKPDRIVLECRGGRLIREAPAARSGWEYAIKDGETGPLEIGVNYAIDGRDIFIRFLYV